MKFRGFLLGAAGLAASLGVSGADAADSLAVAEPVDYVKVCDAFGTGYFYIPGTETCLRIAGYIRFDALVDDSFTDNHYDFKTRARLNIITKSATDYGTLTGYMRAQGYAGENYEVTLAYIMLGGLFVGYDNSFFDYDGGQGGYTLERRGWRSDRVTEHVGYSYAPKEGLGFFVSLEDSWKYTGDYPDLIGGATYVGGPFDFRLSGALINDGSGFAVQAAGSLKLDSIAKGDAVRFLFAYGEDAGYFTAIDKSIGTGSYLMGSSWTALASFRHYWTSSLVSAFTASYNAVGSDHAWEGVSSLNWSPAKGIWIGPEYAYVNSTVKGERNILMLRILRDW